VGHARTVFRRALERGNLLVAEATAKEIGRLSLAEALELTLLIAREDPPRHPRVAARWLRRYLDESLAIAHGDDELPDEPILATTEGGRRVLHLANAEACMRFFTCVVDTTTDAAVVAFP
jgi:hypothetical protein